MSNEEIEKALAGVRDKINLALGHVKEGEISLAESYVDETIDRLMGIYRALDKRQR